MAKLFTSSQRRHNTAARNRLARDGVDVDAPPAPDLRPAVVSADEPAEPDRRDVDQVDGSPDDLPGPFDDVPTDEPDVPEPLTFAEYTAAVIAGQREVAAAQSRRQDLASKLSQLDAKAVDEITPADVAHRAELRGDLMAVDQLELSGVRRLLAIDPEPGRAEARRRETQADELVPLNVAKVKAAMKSIGFPIDVDGVLLVGSQAPAVLAGVVNCHPDVIAARRSADLLRGEVRDYVPHTAGLADRVAQLEQSIRRAAGIPDPARPVVARVPDYRERRGLPPAPNEVATDSRMVPSLPGVAYSQIARA